MPEKANSKTVRVKHPPKSATITEDLVHDAIVATLREITAPAEIMMFARVALEVGCTPLQVYVMANRLMIQPCMVPEQITVEDLCDFAEPTDAQWRALLGADFDFLAADTEHDRVVHQVEGETV